MTTRIGEAGPIDYLVVESPGSKMTREGFPLLLERVDIGIIRILDLVFRSQRDPRIRRRLLSRTWTARSPSSSISAVCVTREC